MTVPQNLQAVLWDMDGVIVDTFDEHYRAWGRIFAELGKPFTLEDFRRTFGMNNRNVFRTLLGYDLAEEEFQALSDRKERYFRESIHGHNQMLPGVGEWLARFDAWGVRQALATSAPQENIDAHLAELGIAHWFTVLVSGEKLPGKPDPAVFLRAAELLDKAPQHCLVIEDSVAGVAAAKAGGMKCVAVLTTNPPEKLIAADVVVKNLRDLTEEMVERIFGGG